MAGVSASRDRAPNDFYATPIYATEAILREIPLTGSILEPAAGQGHISSVLKRFYPENEIISTDLVEREQKFGIPILGGIDFLTYDFNRNFDNVVTNPPFSLAKQFIEKALEISNDKVIMFAKIQLLEGAERRAMWDKTPLKYVYVFSRRVSPLNNGEAVDENGKPWATTMCFAWYVIEQGYTGEPIIRWI